jgi:hypothetical protein
VKLIQKETARMTSRRRQHGDPLEPLSEVWIGLRSEFAEGRVLMEEEIGLMQIIIARRILNYLNSKGGRRPRQPNLSLFDHPDVVNLKLPLDLPDQVVAKRELLRMIEARLSEMPSCRAQAIRSQFGYLNFPNTAELARLSGTSRQNVAKHAKKGLEELKLGFS